MLDNHDKRTRFHFPIHFSHNPSRQNLHEPVPLTGQFSQLFSANEDPRVFPVFIDGPWRLNNSRLNIELQASKTETYAPYSGINTSSVKRREPMHRFFTC